MDPHSHLQATGSAARKAVPETARMQPWNPRHAPRRPTRSRADTFEAAPAAAPSKVSSVGDGYCMTSWWVWTLQDCRAPEMPF